MKLLKYLIYIFLFNGFFLLPNTNALEYDSNIPTPIKKKLNADLDFIFSINKNNKSSNLQKEIFSEFSGDAFKKFFNSRVKKIGFDSCGGSTACAKPNEDPDKIWISPDFINSDIPQILRIITLFHEARHLEASYANWPHEICPIPFLDKDGKDIIGIWSKEKLEGQEACDWSVYGSYAITAVMAENISKFCTECSNQLKQDAHKYALYISLRVVDTNAIEKLNEDLFNIP